MTVAASVSMRAEDFLLNTTDGAAFLLRALPKRRLAAMARRALGDLLLQKTDEELERGAAFRLYRMRG